MGSYSQMIVGGMLLVVAFFFGRYINQQPMLGQDVAEDHTELVGAFESLPNVEKLVAPVAAQVPSEQTLRDRILSQRQAQSTGAGLPPVNSLASAVNTNERLPEFNDAIVEPDFSHLDSSIFESPIRVPKFDHARESLAPRENANRKRNSFRGRFTLNRPAPERRMPRPTNDVYQPFEQQRRLTLRPDVTPVQGLLDNFGKQQPNVRRAATPARRGSLVADNPRYRMVPVRERVGQWNPEPTDYVNYTTVFGDTLHGLSTKFFGTSDRYLDIYLANRQLFESPSEVPINTEIRIPVAK